jgi:hypothetical protein
MNQTGVWEVGRPDAAARNGVTAADDIGEANCRLRSAAWADVKPQNGPIEYSDPLFARFPE